MREVLGLVELMAQRYSQGATFIQSIHPATLSFPCSPKLIIFKAQDGSYSSRHHEQVSVSIGLKENFSVFGSLLRTKTTLPKSS